MSKDLALNSIPLEPSVHIVNQESVTPTSNAEGTIPADEFQYEDVEFDIDSLKDQLGICEILESLLTLSQKVSGQQETRPSVPESGTSGRLPDWGFDPTATILRLQHTAVQGSEGKQCSNFSQEFQGSDRQGLNQQPSSSDFEQSSTGRLDIIRQSLSAKGFSDEAIRIINASWSTGSDKLLKGVYNLQTPSPRYSSTWDVTKVTGYLKTLFPLDQLSLKSLTLKTVMLCALSSALREQTLCALDIRFLNKSGNSLSFSVSERLKTSRPGKSTRKVDLISLPEDNSLCPWLR
ncbi:hypothetical protein P5673_014500 [Acropora cervicornis]|uniref:Uncharacterized protein n=1 Tax=Acropora cervicornis TaxID=6130 RepID=A0AAD9QJ09_ACRCE|nr:hypothetical protein P5673_014500 [Acropora cervicornis]